MDWADTCQPSNHPLNKAVNDRRTGKLAAAEIDRSEDKYLDIIDKFAQAFKIHPDTVYNETSFATLTAFLTKWFRDGEAQDRMDEIDRLNHLANTTPKI